MSVSSIFTVMKISNLRFWYYMTLYHLNTLWRGMLGITVMMNWRRSCCGYVTIVCENFSRGTKKSRRTSVETVDNWAILRTREPRIRNPNVNHSIAKLAEVDKSNCRPLSLYSAPLRHRNEARPFQRNINFSWKIYGKFIILSYMTSAKGQNITHRRL
jgi:hypothetical protein